MALVSSTNRPLTHVAGVADQHLLHVAGACAIGVGVAGGTTVLGAVAPIVLGLTGGSIAGYAYYTHARRMDGLTPEQIDERDRLLADARRVGSK